MNKNDKNINFIQKTSIKNSIHSTMEKSQGKKKGSTSDSIYQNSEKFISNIMNINKNQDKNVNFFKQKIQTQVLKYF